MAASGSGAGLVDVLEAEGIDPAKKSVVSAKELQGILEAIKVGTGNSIALALTVDCRAHVGWAGPEERPSCLRASWLVIHMSFGGVPGCWMLAQDPDDKLDDMSRKFQALFSEPGRFRGCCALVILLRDFLLTLPQRLAVYFLLFDVYRRHKLGVNPFVPVFINALRSGSGISLTERRFAQKLLLSSASDKATGVLSPSGLAESLATQTPATKTPDLTVVMREFELSVPSPPALRQAERGAVVVDPGGTDAKARGRRAIAEALQGDGSAGQHISRDSLAAAEAVATSPTSSLLASTLPAVQASSVTASLRLPVTSGSSSRAVGTAHGARSLLTVSALLAELDRLEAASAAGSAAAAAAAAASSSSSSSDPAAGLRGGIASVPPALVAAAALEGSDPASLGPAELFGLTGFRPVFARPPPPLVSDAEGEMVWLDPVAPPPLLWESSMGGEHDRIAQLRELMHKAITVGMDAGPANRLRAILRESPQAVFESGLTPAKLPDLVARSPLIAVDCLSKLRGSAQIDA
jgi:hypothetical protein